MRSAATIKVSLDVRSGGFRRRFRPGTRRRRQNGSHEVAQRVVLLGMHRRTPFIGGTARRVESGAVGADFASGPEISSSPKPARTPATAPPNRGEVGPATGVSVAPSRTNPTRTTSPSGTVPSPHTPAIARSRVRGGADGCQQVKTSMVG